MSEQQATAGAEAPKKSAAQLKKEAKKKEKLEKYEAKMKAMEASKAAAGDVSDALLLENYHWHFSPTESKEGTKESGEGVYCVWQAD